MGEGAAAAVTISSAMETVWDIVGDCVDFITGSEVMMILFVSCLIPIGFKIFRKARKSVK